MQESPITISWLGHSGFKIKYKDTTLLVDPWFEGNPMFPEREKVDVISDCNFILLSHAHSDHASDSIKIAKERNIPIVGMYDLMQFYEAEHNISSVGFNKGGTVQIGDFSITMVSASHSSSFHHKDNFYYGGAEVGYMITTPEKTIYFSGDTDVMADMQIFGELHDPEIGILCCGGHFTMDMKRAAYAAERFFNFKTIFPCHYKTFPLLEQNADLLRDSLPNVEIIEADVLKEYLL